MSARDELVLRVHEVGLLVERVVLQPRERGLGRDLLRPQPRRRVRQRARPRLQTGWRRLVSEAKHGRGDQNR